LNKWLNSRDTKGVQPRAKYQDFKQKMGDLAIGLFMLAIVSLPPNSPFKILYNLMSGEVSSFAGF